MYVSSVNVRYNKCMSKVCQMYVCQILVKRMSNLRHLYVKYVCHTNDKCDHRKSMSNLCMSNICTYICQNYVKLYVENVSNNYVKYI